MAKLLGKGTVVTLGSIVGIIKSATPFKQSRAIIQGDELVPESGTDAEHFLGDLEPSEAEVNIYYKKGATTLAGLRTLMNNADVDAGVVTLAITQGTSLNESISVRVKDLTPNSIERNGFMMASVTLLKVPPLV